MARPLPLARDAVFVCADADSAQRTIAVGSTDWYAWLSVIDHRSFQFASAAGGFTARKERRTRGGWYWIAYRRFQGTIHKTYLGTSEDVTLVQLQDAAAILAARIRALGVPLDSPSPTVDAPAVPEPVASISPEQLLSTKLYPPRARANLVPRPHLIARLQAGLAGTLTLISAPAGFGKTTLLAQGLGAKGWGLASAELTPQPPAPNPRSVAWIALDVGDNDPNTFLRYLIAALQMIAADVGATALTLLQTSQPPAPESLLTLLLNDLAAMHEYAATYHLQQGMILGQQGGMAGIELDGAITLALVLHACGDSAEAQAMLDRAAAIAQTWRLPQIVLRVATFAARLALMDGRIHDIARWEQANRLRVDDALSEWLEIENCMLARWQIAQRHADDALRLLSRLAAAAEGAGRMGRLIEILALQALAFHVQGQTAHALPALARALALAAPEGYVRLFADEGALMANLLRAAQNQGIAPDYVARLLTAFPRTEGRGLETESAESTHSAPNPRPSALVEPLTNRELEVLRLKAEGASNGEIAARLVITVGTVKQHISNLFGKLGVRSRTQVIRAAHDHGLLGG